ncbi:MAG: hypothetical protein AB8G17_18985 [Gammaproteobacteria bacterium]
MAKTVDYFHSGVFEEHLLEAAHLYDRRLTAMHDSSVPWRRLGEIEQRFDAHIDALRAGKAAALTLCTDRAVTAEPGEVHAALRLLCRAKHKETVLELLPLLQLEEEGIADAAARALRQEAPTDWQVDLARVFNDDKSALSGVLASVFGYRRIAAEALLIRKLSTQPETGVASMAWALGRVGSDKSHAVLRPLLESTDDAISEAAAIALLRLGEKEPAEVALLLAPTRAWPAKVLGIAGDGRAVRVLLDVLNSDKATKDCAIALGMLGDLAAVAPLLAKIEDDEIGESVATALNTITGAELSNEVLVPDAIAGEEPELNVDGEPFGSWERFPLRDPAAWRAWLGDNKKGFHRDARWRMGQEHGAAAVLEGLRQPRSPLAVRELSYEELVIRFKLNVPFECNLLARQQLNFLSVIEKWVASISQAR